MPKTDDAVARANRAARRWRRASSRRRPSCSGATGCRRPGTCPSSTMPSQAIGGRSAAIADARGAAGRRATSPTPRSTRPDDPASRRSEKPQEVLLRELTRAAEGAAQIAEGAGRAHREVTAILNDPVGRRALDRLLINDQTVHDNPELLRSFAAYITPDGHRARIDLTQADRIFSTTRWTRS